ncbi:MAG TPA: PH domain-containing protein, partial [Solirubrobacteraceae bacterium]
AKEPATAQALLPVARRRDVERILTLLVPEFAGDLASSLEPPPRRSLRRFLLPPVAAASVVPAALLPLLGAPALPALALPLAAALFGLAAYRTAGWRLEGDRVVLRRRGLQRTTLVADAKRLPETFTHATLPQRRARIASAGVAVSSGRRVAVPHLETETAEEILGRLSRLAAGSG